MLPFNPIAAVLGVVGFVVAIGGLVWIADAIGDRREAAVWNKINAAIAKTNVDVSKHDELDAKVAAVAEAARAQALAEAKAVEDSCPANAEQASALSRIR